jgi:putative spermidine/putrescine transport system substrate-binding protein
LIGVEREMKIGVGGLACLLVLASWFPNGKAQAAGQERGVPLQDAAGPMIIVGWGGISNGFGQEFFSDPFAAAGTPVQWLAAPGQQVAALQAQRAAGQTAWDVLNALTASQFAALSQQGLLWKLPADVKAFLAKKMPDGVTDYGVAYATVSDVIACNATAVAACPKTPKDFFDVDHFPGQRSLYVGDPLIAMAMALQADGVPADKIFPMDIDRAFRKLQVIRPLIRVFWQSGDQSEQMFRSGEVSVAVIWNGRARNLAQHPTDRMRVSVSWQGSVYEPGYLAVPAGAPHANAAFAYLEWVVNHPDAMARYAEKTGYGFPNGELFDLLPDNVAPWLPEFPPHFSDQVRLDHSWYLQHKSEIDLRWKEFTSAR